MAHYGNVRHPLYSIGEGVGREREERLRAQGLSKKKKTKTKTKTKPLKRISHRNNVWLPQNIINVDVEENTDITPEDIMKKKIWG